MEDCREKESFKISEDKTLALRQKILKKLRDSQGMTEKELLENLTGRRSLKHMAFKRLVEGGEIIRTGEGVKGAPFMYRVHSESEFLNTNQVLDVSQASSSQLNVTLEHGEFSDVVELFQFLIEIRNRQSK